MTDTDSLRELEKQSLFDYATYLGMSITDFVDKRVHTVNQSTRTLTAAMNALGGDTSEMLRHYANASVEALLETDRRITAKLASGVCKTLAEFISAHGNALQQSMVVPKSLPIDQMIDWSFESLERIPLIELYHPIPDAYVQVARNKVVCVQISHSLNQVIENVLVRIFVNYLFPQSALGENPVPPFVMATMKKGPLTPQVCAKALVLSVRAILGDKRAQKSFNLSAFPLSPAYAVLGTQTIGSAINFSLYHEYAHVVLGHAFSSSYEKQDEMMADCLAIHCLAYALKQFFLDNDLSGANAQIVTMCMYAPVLLMGLFSIFQVLGGNRNSSEHPHPLTRKRYITDITMAIFRDHPKLVAEYEEMALRADFLFMYVMKELRLDANAWNQNSNDMPNEVELTVIPWDKLRAEQRIIWLRKEKGGTLFLIINSGEAIVPLFTNPESAGEVADVLRKRFGLDPQAKGVTGISRKDFEKMLLDVELPTGRKYIFASEGSEEYSEMWNLLQS